MNLKFLYRSEIDELKYNTCVHYALNGIIYGYSWYLDVVSEEWGAIVNEDYSLVMPIPFKAKLGIKYIYQPYFTQQLGVFSRNVVTALEIQSFITSIPKEFQYIDYQFNYGNEVEEGIVRRTHHLYLKKSYDEIKSNYSKNLKRNLNKAQKSNLIPNTIAKPEKFVAFYGDNCKHFLKDFEKIHQHTLHRLLYNAMHRGFVQMFSIENENREIIAANAILFSQKFAINLLPISNKEGKQKQAMTLLMDQFIQSKAGTFTILDFEGSDIDSIARFYKGFGAEKVNYPRLKQNNLPWYLRWLKN